MKKSFVILLAAATLAWTSCGFEGVMSSVIKATENGKPLSATITFTNEQGDQKSIDIDCSMRWIIDNLPDWLTAWPPEGNGPMAVTITVTTQNNEETPLNGEIVFLAANGDKLTLKVKQEGDLFATFKADPTPRWESGATVEKNHQTACTFLTDAEGKLFSSTNYKTGRITAADGSNYEMVEFPGPPVQGVKPAGTAFIRTPSGISLLYSIQIVKIEGNKLWLVFREHATSPERRVVQ
jgi:hypothetical protein